MNLPYFFLSDANSNGQYYRIAFSKMYNIDSLLDHDTDWI